MGVDMADAAALEFEAEPCGFVKAGFVATIAPAGEYVPDIGMDPVRGAGFADGLVEGFVGGQVVDAV